MVPGWANDMAGAPKQWDADATNRSRERLREGISINMPGSGEGRMPAASCDLRSTMGAARHEVLADAMLAGLLTVRREEAGKDPELCGVCPLQV